MIIEGIFKDLDPDMVEHWEKECIEARSDCVHVFGGTQSGGAWLQQRPGEYARWLALLKGFGPYLEIGSAAGGALRLAIDALSEIADIYAIDNGKHQHARYFTMWLAQNEQPINVWIDDSHSDDTKAWLAGHRRVFTFVFVDGDHSTKGMLQDLELIRPYINQDSLVGCHDAMMGSVTEGLKQAIASGKWKSVGFAYDEEWHRHMGIRVLQKV